MFYVLSQLPTTVYENKPFAALQASQQLPMVLAVLSDPGVTVIDRDRRDIVVSKARKKSKALREEVCFKAIARSSMGMLDNHFPQDR